MRSGPSLRNFEGNGARPTATTYNQRIKEMTNRKTTTKGGKKGKAEGSKGEVNHSIVAWALASVLAMHPESFYANEIDRAAERLGGAIAEYDAFDLRAEIFLRGLLDAHTSCAYKLEGQDRRKGARAYDKLVTLAGGCEGSPEPKDKTSIAWTCWTMRRIRADFFSEPDAEGMKRFKGAWREFRALLCARLEESLDLIGTSWALPMLAPLVYENARGGKGAGRGK